ncbi:hypothetical protein HNR42_002978 [Deinobacterium chartae]|uniref:Uncharacterized protein n=1 Tax=Deinobacterium chartae TaxID=521158 RepID=A0A841I519_9DEIO|nr:hypothetical protein [Deinobacterium chartae]MBB6099528.1 hypothetical protein [Deinobacterium chartae]
MATSEAAVLYLELRGGASLAAARAWLRARAAELRARGPSPLELRLLTSPAQPGLLLLEARGNDLSEADLPAPPPGWRLSQWRFVLEEEL